MGDLRTDTAVRRTGDNRFVATVSPDWEIWGPMGGYVASIALRAAGEVSPQPLPVSFSCHYLSVAKWGDVDVTVIPRRDGRTASSHRVEISQDGKPVLDAIVWSGTRGEGLEHDESVMPDVPPPDALQLMQDLVPSWPPFAFWNNVDAKQTEREWPPADPHAVWREWLRFRPTPSYDDPWIDATRSVILIDLASWPSVQTRYVGQPVPFYGPTLDLNVAFHSSTAGSEWLLCDGTAPVSTGGYFGWTARLWSESRTMHASGGGQCLYRKVR